MEATHVYVAADDVVMKVPIDGGAPTILASGQHIPGGIDVDATGVYWSAGGSSRKAPK